MSIGERVKARRESLGIERKDLAVMAKMAYSTLADLENGGMASSTKLHRLASALRTNAHYLETGQGDPDRTDLTSDVDVMGFSQAVGLGKGAEAQEYAETHKLKFRAESLSRARLNPNDLAVYYGDGDSMEPTIRDGDAVMFDTSDTAPVDDEIYIVLWRGEYYAKRADVREEYVYFESDNPEGDHDWRKPKRMDAARDPVAVIGRVVWIASWQGKSRRSRSRQGAS